MRRVAWVLAEVDPSTGKGPHPVGAGRGALRDTAEQDGIALDAQGVGGDAGQAPGRIGHSFVE